MFGFGSFLFAQEQVSRLNFEAFGMSVLNVVTYAILGIVLAVIGFKVFDYLTPGKLDEEILQKQNIAAAILAGAVILGICIIVAAAVHG